VQRSPNGRGRPPERDRLGAAGRGGGGAAVIARRPLLAVSSGCAAATVLGFAFGQGSIVALASAFALAAALAAMAALQLRPARRQKPPPRASDNEMPVRLRQIAGLLRESEQSEVAVDRSLRPLL